jgi:hypothetical protein
MKRLLIQLDCDELPSSFDTLAALDAGADAVLDYRGVAPGEVAALVHGVIFARGSEDLRHIAIWVGGSSVPRAEELLHAVRASFFAGFRVSVMTDANGCNTTAAATVAALVGIGPLADQRAVVLAGLGPVGVQIAELLAREGARVTVTTPWPELLGERWNAERAAGDAARAEAVGREAGFTVRSIARRDMLLDALQGASLVVSAGPLGVNLLGEEDWPSHPTLRMLADLNPSTPLGIAGIEATDTGNVRHGKVVFGALGLGGLKMKVHKACVERLFEAHDQVLDRLTIYEVARSVLA